MIWTPDRPALTPDYKQIIDEIMKKGAPPPGRR
jgi:hypothetical protein